MFRYSPYWVKPIVVPPEPVAFPGELVYLDFGYTRPGELNKLAFINHGNLSITDRIEFQGINSSVALVSSSTDSTGTIEYDWVNDNVLVIDVNFTSSIFRLSSFDPRTLQLNWTTTLPTSYSFCTTPITASYVWLNTSGNLRAYNLLTGALVYNFTMTSPHAIVGGTTNRTIKTSDFAAISDSIVFAGYDFANAHNGATVEPYQAYKVVPLTSTTYQVEAVTGIPGVVGSYVPNTSFGQGFPAYGHDNDLFVTFSASVDGQLALGKLDMVTGSWTTLITSDPGMRYTLGQISVDTADVTSSKIWLRGSKRISGVTTSHLFEFSYPACTFLGQYGSRLQGSGNTSVTNYAETGANYIYFIVGSVIYALSGYNTVGIWDVGDYDPEPIKVLPHGEATNTSVGTDSTQPKQIYFPRILMGTSSPAGASNWLAIRPASKVLTGSIPSAVVPAIAGTLTAATGSITVPLWQKVTWIEVVVDGLNTTELSIANDGLNETAIAWLYDSTGKQVTFNNAFPIFLGESVKSGLYYLAVVNIKNDTTSLIAPSSTGFRIVINNSPAIVQHDITFKLSKSYK